MIDREYFVPYRGDYWTLIVATVCRVRNELRFRAVGWAYRTCMQDTLYVFRPKQWLMVTPLIEAIPWRCIGTGYACAETIAGRPQWTGTDLGRQYRNSPS